MAVSDANSLAIEELLPISGRLRSSASPEAYVKARAGSIWVGMSASLLGASKAHDRVGHVAAGNEGLGAIDDVAITAFDGARPHSTGVRARAGLGEGIGRQVFAAGQRWKVATLLLLGSSQPDGQAAERLHAECEGGGDAELTEFLNRHDQRQRPAADPSVLWRERDRQDVVFGEEFLDIPGELARFVDLGRSWLHPLEAEVVDHLADLLLLLVEGEVHQTRTSSRAITMRWTWFVPS